MIVIFLIRENIIFYSAYNADIKSIMVNITRINFMFSMKVESILIVTIIAKIKKILKP